jgi:mRNA interferase RelE/StbE
MTESEWTPKALDLLDGLDSEAQERLVKKLDEATDWISHRLEKLTGYPYYKLRAGGYRDATNRQNSCPTVSISP